MVYKSNLISVILPVYNVEEYLIRCLDSIIHNTYQEIEIICIDDGSTDKSGFILDQYQKQDERIIVIHTENQGISEARNTGLNVSTGEFICFIDSDDWIHERFFEFLIAVQKKENADVVDSSYANATASFTFNKNMTLNYKKVDNSQLLKGGICWRRLFRHELVENIRFRNFQIEDTVYNMDVLCQKQDLSMFLVDLPLYAYFQRDNSLSKKLTAKSESIWMREYLQRCKSNEDDNIKSMLLQRVQKRALSLRYISYIQKKRADIAIYNQVLKESFKINVKQNIGYKIFYFIPFSYRLFRIMQDPSMMKEEKRLRGLI